MRSLKKKKKKENLNFLMTSGMNLKTSTVQIFDLTGGLLLPSTGLNRQFARLLQLF